MARKAIRAAVGACLCWASWLSARCPRIPVQALGREVEALKADCLLVGGPAGLDAEAHFKAPGRRASRWARLAVRLLRGFL